MKRVVLTLVVTTALLGGCLVTGPGDRITVPPVRPGTNPPRWEYQCLEERSLAVMQSKANRLGAVGFELASSAGRRYEHFWCFKRRLP